jgi:hypothetical protein
MSSISGLSGTSSVSIAMPREQVGEKEPDKDSDDRGAKAAAAPAPPQSQSSGSLSFGIRIGSAAMAALTQMQQG